MNKAIFQKSRLTIWSWYQAVFLPKIKNMLFSSVRLIERKEGLDLLDKILANKNNCLVIHYSCEEFNQESGKTPRITSICVRNLGNTLTDSFSIHKFAEKDHLDFTNLSDAEYDLLEKKMLSKFYSFVRKNKKYNWIHWKMRNSNYGFQAIADRFVILRGKPENIDNDRKYDFPRILEMIYTAGYAKVEGRRLLDLAELNGISTANAMTGTEEAKAFESKQYLALGMSTLHKVEMMDTLIDHAYKRRLKVKSKLRDIYGLDMSGVIEIISSKWYFTFIIALITYVLGAATEPIIQCFFGTAPKIPK